MSLFRRAFDSITIDGLYLEFGTYKGKSANKIAKLIYPKKLYTFDSFKGLPQKWWGGFSEGHFKVDSLPELDANVVAIVGYYENTLPLPFNQDIAFIHFDCDLYSSTMTILKSLRNNIVNGTIMLFDEWIIPDDKVKSEEDAFSDWVALENLNYEVILKSNDRMLLKIKTKGETL